MYTRNTTLVQDTPKDNQNLYSYFMTGLSKIELSHVCSR